MGPTEISRGTCPVATPGAEVFRRAAELTAQGQSFVLATVIRRTAPSSARPGLKAVITADGTLEGWLGGACIEPTVCREALRALQAGKPRLVVFTSDPGAHRSEATATVNRSRTTPDAGRSESTRPQATSHPLTTVHPMTCHSGGTVEVYVEPQLPPPVLVLFGDSPVNRALAVIAPAAGYAVRMVEPAAELEPASGPDLVAVVATMGEWDEEAVAQARDAGARYVGLVASPRRAAKLRHTLEARLGAQALTRLVSPAGLDLGAVEPGEIAVTILAQIIQQRRESVVVGEAAPGAGEIDTDPAAPKVGEGATGPSPPVTAVDPVCGMEVEVSNALRSYEHVGTLYYFCCSRCRNHFSRSPDHWVAA